MPDSASEAPAPATLDTFRPETTVATRRPPPVRPAPSPEDAALLARLRAEAARARGRAVAAGVAESVLARGDSGLARADSLAARRRTAAAAAQLSAASTLWSDAAARPDTTRQAVPPPVRAPDPPVRAPEPPVRAPEPPAPARDPAEEIRKLFGEYGAAIESRSVEAIRRVYPGLSPAQSREWEEFFEGVGGIEVELGLTALEVSGESAVAQLAGVYVFDDPGTRRTRRENVTFQAQLRQESGRWRITSLR
jgi:hypothetical protein